MPAPRPPQRAPTDAAWCPRTARWQELEAALREATAERTAERLDDDERQRLLGAVRALRAEKAQMRSELECAARPLRASPRALAAPRGSRDLSETFPRPSETFPRPSETFPRPSETPACVPVRRRYAAGLSAALGRARPAALAPFGETFG